MLPPNSILTHIVYWTDKCRRLETDGPNALTPPPVTPWYVQLAMKFIDPFMLLLEVCMYVCLYVGGGEGF